VLSDIPPQIDDRVLIDFRTADDAGVYRWRADRRSCKPSIFSRRSVDDPYIYGEIAAANAVSDIYAMGGRPLTALAIAAFPKDGLEPGTIRAIFQGGFDKLRRSGRLAARRTHSAGPGNQVRVRNHWRHRSDPHAGDAGAKAGDVLFLTKPLGTGIVGTAIKFDRVDASLAEEAVRSMRTLNRAAAEAIQTLPPGDVHACTDVTGFGLIGHATNGSGEQGDDGD